MINRATPRLRAWAGRVDARWRSRYWLDVALAVLFTVGGQLELSQAHTAGLALGLLLFAQTMPVAFMRPAPVLALSISAAAELIEALTMVPSNTLSGLLAPLLLLYTLARHTSLRTAAGFGGIALLTAGVHVSQRPGFEASDLIFVAVLCGLDFAAGRYVRGRQHERARVAAEAEAERALAAAALATAVAEERSRIARELHDVVAHGMGVMVVQAAAAEQLLDSDPDSARQPMTTVRQTGQGALVEMRRLLGLLRTGAGGDLTDTGDGDTTEPQPGLAELPALVAQFRAAGLSIDLTESGSPSPLPVGLQLTVYRLVQEALTNALKHAHGATVTVRIDYRADQVDVLARNPIGRPSLAAINDGAGHGLVGMRERVRLYDGRLEAGAQPDGSFVVHTVLPVRP